jgi:hypothetical protein
MHALFSLSSNLIPVMQFERDFMQLTGLTLDLTRFAFAFIAAVVSGVLVRWIRNPTGARAACWFAQSCTFVVLLDQRGTATLSPHACMYSNAICKVKSSA